MFEAFTAQARHALAGAQREAREMGHGAVEVEHLLVGLFACEDEIVSRVWADFGLTSQPVREAVRRRLGVDPGTAGEGRISFSPAAKDALRSAYRFGMGEPGPEHVMIVLLRRGEGGASEVLRELGADPNQVRFETKERAFPREGPGSSLGSRGHTGLLKELDFEDS
ncbi:MAG TPA: Clp protease N-terminal domain-containing protein [Solirubrobacteraceae bacterium]|jgi:ATP-dependent Clp protease ATP-binding subunit ClpA